jgi:2-phospho-L-lactate guanylyltransferase
VKTIAILPVKSFPSAKQRLRDGLDPPQREDLAEAMFTDVLSSLRLTSVAEIVVVTASPGARTIAHAQGARVIEDSETGHNAAAALGIEAAVEAGADRVLLVPGDCPALDPDEVGELLVRPVAPPFVLIVPDRHGTGTNALVIAPPHTMAPSFGPGSCQRHVELARASGARAEVVELRSLALDIDTPDDLDLLGHLPRARTTHRLLNQLSRC